MIDANRHFSIAPTRYISGQGALSELGGVIRLLSNRVLIVRGEHGYTKHQTQIKYLLSLSAITFTDVIHTGPCTDEAIAAITTQTDNAVGAIVGVGGGRVLDVAKSVADVLTLPCVTVPTSPATCSAVTALGVYYNNAGAYLESRTLHEPPAAAIIDLDILSTTPNRLLAAGIIDALAKYYEVQFAVQHNQTTNIPARAALALCHELKTLIDQNAVTALTTSRPASLLARQLMAETAILLPGLIGGLGGEVNKLAAAHTIHNALTYIPGSKVSLHGELVGFGILVQMKLAGADLDGILSTGRLLRQLQLPCTLEELGCAEFYNGSGPRITEKAITFPVMKRVFPTVTASHLHEVMLEVDSLIRALLIH
jgi:glycerol dehydrogenase-like iron-containing ADH family enzyme